MPKISLLLQNIVEILHKRSDYRTVVKKSCGIRNYLEDLDIDGRIQNLGTATGLTQTT